MNTDRSKQRPDGPDRGAPRGPGLVTLADEPENVDVSARLSGPVSRPAFDPTIPTTMTTTEART
jgi:hypothetical protein